MYITTDQFLKSQLLLGAKQLDLDGITALRYSGPLNKVIVVQGPALDDVAVEKLKKKLSLRDAILLIPVNLYTGSNKHIEHDFVVTLGATEEETFNKLEKRSQRAIRQAKEHGITVKSFDKDTITGKELDGFYAVYKDRMKRFGSPAVPKAYIEFLLQQGCVVVNAYHNGKIIAGATLLHDTANHELINELVASSEDALHLRPNNLLYWHFLLIGLKNKCKTVNLGPSPVDSPVATFKTSIGAVPVAKYVVFERYPKLLKIARKLRY